MNGEGRGDSSHVIAVGVGALGSQVAVEFGSREVLASGPLVDQDLLQPHNLGRHALGGWALGVPKALGLTDMLNSIVEGPPIACGIATDVLRESGPWQPGRRVLEGRQLHSGYVYLRLLWPDTYAMTSSHQLAEMSLFLNPSGTALTMLAEDRARTATLDVLEMQHYRALISNSDLDGLLSPASTMRSGVGCRDVSTQIPQDLVGLLSGIASRAVRRAVESDDAEIATWRVDESD